MSPLGGWWHPPEAVGLCSGWSTSAIAISVMEKRVYFPFAELLPIPQMYSFTYFI